MKENMERYTFRIKPSLLKNVGIIAHLEGKNVSTIFRESIKAYIVDFHKMKKEEIAQRDRDFLEMAQELGGWSTGNNSWLE